MLRSLISGPLSWWPVGFAAGWLICEALGGIQRARRGLDTRASRRPDDHAHAVDEASGLAAATVPLRALRRAD